MPTSGGVRPQRVKALPVTLIPSKQAGPQAGMGLGFLPPQPGWAIKYDRVSLLIDGRGDVGKKGWGEIRFSSLSHDILSGAFWNSLWAHLAASPGGGWVVGRPGSWPSKVKDRLRLPSSVQSPLELSGD